MSKSVSDEVAQFTKAKAIQEQQSRTTASEDEEQEEDGEEEEEDAEEEGEDVRLGSIKEVETFMAEMLRNLPDTPDAPRLAAAAVVAVCVRVARVPHGANPRGVGYNGRGNEGAVPEHRVVLSQVLAQTAAERHFSAVSLVEQGTSGCR